MGGVAHAREWAERSGEEERVFVHQRAGAVETRKRGDETHRARAKEMAALGQRIEVLSLTRDGKFDSSVFYDAFTKEHCGAREGDNALGRRGSGGSELQKEFLKKSRKRRRLKQTKLWLVPGKIGIPVGVYALVSEAKKSASILVDGKDLGEIRREQIYVDVLFRRTDRKADEEFRRD